jgi:hypothetical protein
MTLLKTLQILDWTLWSVKRTLNTDTIASEGDCRGQDFGGSTSILLPDCLRFAAPGHITDSLT